jgi:hypothetical protein
MDQEMASAAGRKPNNPHPDTPKNCQFGNLGRNALRGPNFTWSDFYLTKWFPVTERVKLRFDVQFFNVFNHPNFALPSRVLAGIPGKVCPMERAAPKLGLVRFLPRPLRRPTCSASVWEVIARRA